MENTGVTLRFALKILRKLATGGVIQSCEGVSGGRELAWNPADINPADAVGLIERPTALDGA